MLKLLGARFQRGGIKMSKIPIFGNALNATVEGVLGDKYSIEIMNLFGMI